MARLFMFFFSCGLIARHWMDAWMGEGGHVARERNRAVRSSTEGQQGSIDSWAVCVCVRT